MSDGWPHRFSYSWLVPVMGYGLPPAGRYSTSQTIQESALATIHSYD